MSPWRLALCEAWGRAFSASLVVVVVATMFAGALAAKWLGAAASRETRRVQRDLGFNLRVLPREADLDAYLLRGYADATMPRGVIDRLAERKTVSYNHLVATLHKPIELGGRPAVLTGVSGTFFPSGKKKPPMQKAINEGSVQLGSAIAERLGATKGGSIILLGETLTVERVVAPTGGADDLRVWANLGDAQRLLGLEDRISEVRAIDCLCLAPEDDPQAQLRAEIESAAPETQVVLMSKLATARARQRRMTDRLAEYATPLSALVGGVGVGAIGVFNARQRRQEFAVLRSLGYGPGMVVGLVLLRGFACGLLGAVAGWWIALRGIGPLVTQMFPVTGAKSVPAVDPAELGAVLAVTLAVIAVASIAPAMFAMAQTPAASLRDN